MPLGSWLKRKHKRQRIVPMGLLPASGARRLGTRSLTRPERPGGQQGLPLLARSCAAAVLCLSGLLPAHAQTAKIVGVGVVACSVFTREVAETPSVERDYLTWAQGFMSGALMRAPMGVDEGIDLLPSTFPLQAQANFLRAFCKDHPDQDYVDAVHALYRHLRPKSTL